MFNGISVTVMQVLKVSPDSECPPQLHLGVYTCTSTVLDKKGGASLTSVFFLNRLYYFVLYQFDAVWLLLER